MDIDALLTSQFPSLADLGFSKTSPATSSYNCIAWAAGRTDEWWWPTPLGACSRPRAPLGNRGAVACRTDERGGEDEGKLHAKA